MKKKFLIDLRYSSDTGFDVLAVPVDAPTVELEVDEKGATPEAAWALFEATGAVIEREFDTDKKKWPPSETMTLERLQELARLIADEYTKDPE